MYEVFEHTADLGLRIRAPSREALWSEAGRGLFSLIVADLDSVRPTETVAFELSADDDEYLLFDWLNELLYTFESRRLLLVQFDVKLTDLRLSAVARGEPLDPGRHRMEHEVKAITYHGLRVEQTDEGWLAEVIVDI